MAVYTQRGSPPVARVCTAGGGVRAPWAPAAAPTGSAALGDTVGFGHGWAGSREEPEPVSPLSVQHRKQRVRPSVPLPIGCPHLGAPHPGG